ncbi:hypothetical protein [Pseudomonas sp.]|uniref:hypothetical protein n=1 Tax=Pseudomonas sp. TaxID=306 RepID=UPI002585EE82|nr:hypothetical protein [Pseudomonas sp.]
MSSYLNARRRQAAALLGKDASEADIDEYIRMGFSRSMGSHVCLALQAAEQGSLWVKDRSPVLSALAELKLIELRGDFWHLTPLGETLMAEWRQNARRL